MQELYSTEPLVEHCNKKTVNVLHTHIHIYIIESKLEVGRMRIMPGLLCYSTFKFPECFLIWRCEYIEFIPILYAHLIYKMCTYISTELMLNFVVG